MKTNLLKVSLRNQAIYIPSEYIQQEEAAFHESTSLLLADMKRLGFTFSEPLLRRLHGTHTHYKVSIAKTLSKVMGMQKNWTPLVAGWNVSTGESVWDHFFTWCANVAEGKQGAILPCGHLIPDNTFPLERYTGCPFCGKPFVFGKLEGDQQGSKLKVLEWWDDDQLQRYFCDLLTSRSALDATQTDSLKIMLSALSLPEEINIGIKETLVVVIDELIDQGREQEAGRLFRTPIDIMRYLWYKHTGSLQIHRPKTIVERTTANHQHLARSLNKSAQANRKAKTALRLKYSRRECRMVAGWLNELPMKAETACELIHSKRGMWVRFIRALRLPEYGRKAGYQQLAHLLDVFYNEDYDVLEGRISYYRSRRNADQTFRLLKERPSLFSRSLFSNMLWFGPDQTIRHFREVLDDIPARLIISLNMYAAYYFDPKTERTVRPAGGNLKRIPANKQLLRYDTAQLQSMQAQVEEMFIEVMHRRFAKMPTESATIFIDPDLNRIPLAIGERSESVQDMPNVLMGTRFPVEGKRIRLFMQWGGGLKAQHLDMDLSCRIAYENRTDSCSYYQLTTTGCQHSGDVRHIPDKIGTAEYIEIDLDELDDHGARFVSFTCNAYSQGSLSPNLVVGWMDSRYPMRISPKSGVAYDPSCVQHQIRVVQGTSKGLVFGVLDVKQREIIWLEVSFGSQIVAGLDVPGVEALLIKLEQRLTIGQLLRVKSEAQGLSLVNDPETADEVYDMPWARNTAAVMELFLI